MRNETKRYGAGSVIQAVVKGRRGGEDARLRVTESDSRGYWITGVTCALATEAVFGGEAAPGSHTCATRSIPSLSCTPSPTGA